MNSWPTQIIEMLEMAPDFNYFNYLNRGALLDQSRQGRDINYVNSWAPQISETIEIIEVGPLVVEEGKPHDLNV